MPTYAYRCASCSHEFDAIQKFSDAPLNTCPECGNEIRRVFHPVGIVFKGSGWYINDSRGTDKRAEAKPSSDSEPKTSEKPAAAATSAEPAAKPAATTPAPASAD